jgi:thioredoxin-like negative regulator of GroEL
MLVHFCTAWSAQCQILAPSLEVLASELRHQLKIAQINLDQCPELAERFGVNSLPTLILFDHGTPIGRFTRMTAAQELKARLLGLLADYSV